MRSILTIVLASSVMMAVQAQTWVGNYAVDLTVCNGTQCCCFTGIVSLTRPTTTALVVNSKVNGTQCSGGNVFLYNGYYPSGYYTTLNMGSQNLDITLSADSQTITAVNPLNAACNGKAVKSDGAKPMINSMGMATVILLAVISRMVN